MSDPNTNPPRVLLVDDEPHITHILARKLTQLGAEVRTARNGVEGFETAVEFRPAIVLSDLQMPKADGLEMAIRLAEHESTAETPIIMISGRGFLLDDTRLRQTRIVEVLEKPFSVRDVMELVAKQLGWTGQARDAA